MAEMNTNTVTNENGVAEPATEPTTTPKADESSQDTQPSVQELMVKIAMLEKKADKASKEAGEWRKKFNSTLSEKEQLDIAKAEEQARFKEEYEDMKRQLQVSKYRENFLNLGYPKDLAEKAATAQFDNDTDTLFAVQSKAKEISEKALRAELLKTMPTSPISNDGESITKEQFDKMGYSERAELFERNPDLYKKLTNNI